IHPGQVRADHGLPVLEGEHVYIAEAAESRIVDQDVRLKLIARHLLYPPVDGFMPGDIQRNGNELIAQCLPELLQFVGAPGQPVYRGPFVDQGMTEGGANSAACSCDNSRFRCYVHNQYTRKSWFVCCCQVADGQMS